MAKDVNDNTPAGATALDYILQIEMLAETIATASLMTNAAGLLSNSWIRSRTLASPSAAITSSSTTPMMPLIKISDSSFDS
jgi:hypothetical protein